LQQLIAFNEVTLQPFPYFRYLLQTNISSLTLINDLGKIWLSGHNSTKWANKDHGAFAGGHYGIQ
jgi:hypothetical protein